MWLLDFRPRKLSSLLLYPKPARLDVDWIDMHRLQAVTMKMQAAAQTARHEIAREIDVTAERGLATGTPAGWEQLVVLFPSANILVSELQVRTHMHYSCSCHDVPHERANTEAIPSCQGRHSRHASITELVADLRGMKQGTQVSAITCIIAHKLLRHAARQSHHSVRSHMQDELPHANG